MCLYRFSTRLFTTIESPVAKKATKRLIRCFSAGVILCCRSAISFEINLFNGPCVFNRVAIHLIELRVSHGAKRQIESGIENHVEVTLSCQKVVLREAAKLLAVVAGFRVFEATQ